MEAKEGDTVYVCNTAIKNFMYFVLPFLKCQIVLVSGDSDNCMPTDLLSEDEFQTFISNSKIRHWFCQNLLLPVVHPKMTHLPIGLDYHTLRNHMGSMHPWGPGMLPKDQENQLKVIQATLKPLKSRHRLCYSNFHHNLFGINQRGDRQEVLQTVPSKLVYYHDGFRSREECWRTQAECCFVLSPRGGGYDCHRTWEALLLGCIPIVKSSNMDALYEDLPVLILQEWKDLTQDLMNETVEKFSTRNFRLEKLTLRYWIQFFKSI